MAHGAGDGGWGGAGIAGSQGPGDDELGDVGDEPRCSAWLMKGGEGGARGGPAAPLVSAPAFYQRFILPVSIFDLWPRFAFFFSSSCKNIFPPIKSHCRISAVGFINVQLRALLFSQFYRRRFN